MEQFDPMVLRRLLARWTTGISVMTTLTRDGEPVGKAANSFHSVSLDPPLVGWCVDVGSTRYAEWLAAPGYVVHILSAEQRGLVKRFAQRGGDKFTGIDWAPGRFGMPILRGASVRIQCRTWKQLEAGDHTYLVGEILEIDDGPAETILFHGGKPRTVAELVRMHDEELRVAAEREAFARHPAGRAAVPRLTQVSPTSPKPMLRALQVEVSS